MHCKDKILNVDQALETIKKHILTHWLPSYYTFIYVDEKNQHAMWFEIWFYMVNKNKKPY
jgi:hypothetical protein